MIFHKSPQAHSSKTQRIPIVKREWRVKNVRISCNVVLTSFKSSTKVDWYFDSGSYRHMIGEKNYLSNLKYVNAGKVTFGDKATSKIVRKGQLNYPSFPPLNDIYDYWRSH